VRSLSSQPWHDAAALSRGALVDFAAKVRREALALRADELASTGGNGHALVAAGEWNEFVLYGGGSRRADNCARCPITATAMARYKAAVDLAMAGGGEILFAFLKPGSHLRPHCGATNTRLTCHLGLVVPRGCSIRCGDSWRSWEPGRCLVFDDSFEHEIVNRHATEDLVLLVFNFWHPELAPELRSKLTV
jgi:aspartate beta-hydroxylase